MSEDFEPENVEQEEPQTPEEQAAEQLDFDDPGNLTEERMADYLQQRADEGEEGLSGDADDTEFSDEDTERLETLAEAAVELGFTDEDLEAIGDIDVLEEEILKALEDDDDDGEDYGDVDTDALSELGIEIDESLPEEMRNALQGFAEQINEKLSAYKEAFENFNSFSESSKMDEVESSFDQMITNDPSVRSLFGDAPTEDLADDSTYLENRVILLEEMNTIAAGYQAMDRDVPDDTALMQMAMQTAFGEEMSSIRENGLRADINSRREGFTAMPTQRRGRSLSPEAAAKQSVRAYMEQTGLLGGIEDDQF